MRVGVGKVVVHATECWPQELKEGIAYRVEYDEEQVTITAL